MNTPCPHCKTTAKHGERISCCSRCNRLFMSGTAFDAHYRIDACRDPEAAGLIERPVRQRGTDAHGWGHPAPEADTAGWWKP